MAKIHHWKIHALLVLVGMIYGANFSIAKTVMPEFLTPSTFILWRMGGALLLFTLYHRIFIRERLRSKADLLRIAVCSFFGMFLNMLLFFEGLSLTAPVNASLIITTTPIVVLILSAVFLGERMAWWQILGIGMGFSGASLLILSAHGGLTPGNWRGDLLVMANATAYAIYLVAVRPLMRTYHPVTIVRWAFLFAFMYLLPWTAEDAWNTHYAQIPSSAWAAIAFVVIATTFLVYLFNAIALRHVSASVVGAYIYLQPVFAAFFALVLDLYPVAWQTAFYALLIMGGVYLSSRKPPARALQASA